MSCSVRRVEPTYALLLTGRLWFCLTYKLKGQVGVWRAGKAVAADSDSDDEESEGSPPETRRAHSMGEPPMGGPLSGGLTIPTSNDDPGARPLCPGAVLVEGGLSAPAQGVAVPQVNDVHDFWIRKHLVV